MISPPHGFPIDLRDKLKGAYTTLYYKIPLTCTSHHRLCSLRWLWTVFFLENHAGPCAKKKASHPPGDFFRTVADPIPFLLHCF